MPTLQQKADFIFIPNSTGLAADIALVFGTKSWKFALNKALQLYKNGKIKKIVFSGGINHHSGINEAQTMTENAIKHGVKPEDIILEDQSSNTLDNVLFSIALLEQKIGLENIKSVIAVVKIYHAKRALMTMKRHLPKHIVLKCCSYEINFSKKNWEESETGRDKVEKEYKKIKEYLDKGDIIEI